MKRWNKRLTWLSSIRILTWMMTAEMDSMETTSASYLNKIFLHEPNYLFNYSNLGYQTYFTSQESLRVMEKLYFDVHRLGELSGQVAVTEPIIRNASMISFDIGAIRSSDAVGNANATPNGFYGEEACQIAVMLVLMIS